MVFENEEQVAAAVRNITDWILNNVELDNHAYAEINNINQTACYRLEQLLCGRQEGE